MRPPREDTEPWYKQFWPWFLISLPLIAVIASIVTLNIAIETDDGLVTDDYYKEGLGIHRDADSAAKAKALQIAAQIGYDAETGAITLMLDRPLAEKARMLVLDVTHPTRSDQDQSVQVVAVDEQRYAGRIEALGPANWKIKLQPEDKSWRIDGRLNLPAEASARLD